MNQTKNDKKVLVAYVSDLSVGVGKRVKVGEEEIALFIQNKGDVHAIQNRCPHKGGPLSEGIVSGEYVFCPLHDWKINMEDGLVQAPDKGCVKRYNVEIADDAIYLIL